MYGGARETCFNDTDALFNFLPFINFRKNHRGRRERRREGGEGKKNRARARTNFARLLLSRGRFRDGSLRDSEEEPVPSVYVYTRT